VALASLQGAHEGASLFSRELADWLPSRGSADADLQFELPVLAARGRDLARNHGVASGSIATLVDNVVGTGFVLNARPDYRALGRTKDWADGWARDTEALWRNWAETTAFDAGRRMNFHVMTRLMFRTELVEGDACAIPLWLPDRPGGSGGYATCFQIIDPTRLGNPYDRTDGPLMRGGVEIDEYTAPVAYHVRKTHPYDAGNFLGAAAPAWERIEATTGFGRPGFVHLYTLERPGQTRGKPIMTSVLPMFKMLDHYGRAELQAAVVNAMIAAFVESSMPMEQIMQLFGGDPEAYMSTRQEWQAKLKGGAIIPMMPGDKLASFTPGRPNAAYGAFTENILRHIGTSMGLPLELLMKDFSKTNYSSARASLLEAWRYFNNRRDWIITHWADVVYSLWLEEAANKGDVEAPDFYAKKAAWSRAQWIGDGRGWVDPLKEAQASEQRRKSRVSTLARECAEQGLDWQEVLEQQAAEKKYAESLGIDLEPVAVAPITRGAQVDPSIDPGGGDPANDQGGDQPSGEGPPAS
jgi:lambda family phage portal protein